MTRNEIAARVAIGTRWDWESCLRAADLLIASGRLKPGQTDLRRKDWKWLRKHI